MTPSSNLAAAEIAYDVGRHMRWRLSPAWVGGVVPDSSRSQGIILYRRLSRRLSKSICKNLVETGVDVPVHAIITQPANRMLANTMSRDSAVGPNTVDATAIAESKDKPGDAIRHTLRLVELADDSVTTRSAIERNR